MTWKSRTQFLKWIPVSIATESHGFLQMIYPKSLKRRSLLKQIPWGLPNIVIKTSTSLNNVISRFEAQSLYFVLVPSLAAQQSDAVWWGYELWQCGAGFSIDLLGSLCKLISSADMRERKEKKKKKKPWLVTFPITLSCLNVLRHPPEHE